MRVAGQTGEMCRGLSRGGRGLRQLVILDRQQCNPFPYHTAVTGLMCLSSNRHCHLSSSCNEGENHRKHLYRGFREEPLPSAQNRQLCWSSVLHCQDAATQCGDRKGDSAYGARKVGLGRNCNSQFNLQQPPNGSHQHGDKTVHQQKDPNSMKAQMILAFF
nr:uncharacterized protein LOC123573897 [Macaca fascicularis]